MPKASKDIRLSPSSLAAWFANGCPARWNFEREYQSLEENKFFEVGEKVHSLMEYKGAETFLEDKTVRSMYLKLKEMELALAYKVHYRELKQVFEIYPGVTWARRIDAIVELTTGEWAIVDYKTNWGSGWKALEDGVIPPSWGFQTPGYIVPPEEYPKDWPDKQRWPKVVIYMVTPMRGNVQVIRQDGTKTLYANLMASIKMARDSIQGNRFPKIYSKDCVTCPMRHPCFSLPEPEKYVRKRNGSNRSKASG